MSKMGELVLPSIDQWDSALMTVCTTFFPLAQSLHHILSTIISPLTKTVFQLIRWSCNVPGITFVGGTSSCNIQVVVATSHFGNWSCISHPWAGMTSVIAWYSFFGTFFLSNYIEKSQDFALLENSVMAGSPVVGVHAELCSSDAPSTPSNIQKNSMYTVLRGKSTIKIFILQDIAG